MLKASVFHSSFDRKRTVSTGVPALDENLHGGWEQGTIHELAGTRGCGKTTLALRTAASLTSQRRLVALISKGSSLFPPAIQKEGVQLSYFLWLRPTDLRKCHWAAEQVARSGLFSLLLLFELNYDEKNARRLQLHAQKSDTTVIFLSSSLIQRAHWIFSFRANVQRKMKSLISLEILKTKRAIKKMYLEVSL